MGMSEKQQSLPREYRPSLKLAYQHHDADYDGIRSSGLDDFEVSISPMFTGLSDSVASDTLPVPRKSFE